MDATATKVAADAAGSLIKADPVLGSLLILALLGCCLLGWLLYRSGQALNACQEKRVEEGRTQAKLLSESSANTAELIRVINARTPIQDRMASDIADIKQGMRIERDLADLLRRERS